VQMPLRTEGNKGNEVEGILRYLRLLLFRFLADDECS
jgi:hypothetical protein